MDHLCYVWLVFVMLCYLLVTCWERADSWLLFVMLNCVFVTFPCGILGQMCYMIVSIPDLCHLSYFSPNEDLVNNKVYYTNFCQILSIYSKDIERNINVPFWKTLVQILSISMHIRN